jgi:hypothetical protein
VLGISIKKGKWIEPVRIERKIKVCEDFIVTILSWPIKEDEFTCLICSERQVEDLIVWPHMKPYL